MSWISRATSCWLRIRICGCFGSFDLLVMNTKDDEQMAMHGLAYPLAIEVRSIPLLLL